MTLIRPPTDRAVTGLKRPSHDIRRVSTIGLTVIGLTFGVIGLWAATVPLSSAVIGRGEVMTQVSRQTIQHLEGGILRRILVREGDHVKAGQVLFQLNPVQADATLESARNELFSALAKSDRLSAELGNRGAVTFSPEVMAQASDPFVATAMTDETDQFRQRRATNDVEVAVLQSRIDQYKTEIRGIDDQRSAMQTQVGLLDDELKGLDELYKKDLVPKPRILDLERQRAELQGQIGTSIADKAKAEGSIGEVQLQIQQVRQQFYQDDTKDLSELETQLGDLRQRYIVAQDAAHRIDIVSPVDGLVQNLRAVTVGGVVRPGDPLAEVAPDEAKMIIEARFSPNDIDSIHEGQVVQLRFSTFHSRTIPVIQGTIRSVSIDRLSDEATHQSYYLAIIDVPTRHLPQLMQGKLRAGLPVEVIATTGSRTALQYAFKPLTDALTGTMRER